MIKLTPQIIRAAAQDAGNLSMKAAGRTEWNEDDWNEASAKFAELSEFLGSIQENHQ